MRLSRLLEIGNDRLFAVAFLAAVTVATSLAQDRKTQNWSVYDGDPAGDHYSDLEQINRQNVSKLAVAWKFDTDETGGLETNPIIIAGVVYAGTPSRKVIALDAATGKLIWRFDSGVPGKGQMRGVTYWTDGHENRIFVGIANFLYALNASDGKPIQSFGEGGRVDLRKNLGRDPRQQSFMMTSPGAIFKDLIIVGGKEPEEHPSPPGDIRAYDVHTGALRWSFHTIPRPGEFGYDTWPKDAWTNAGAANNWAGFVVDTNRGIVYAPTGSAVPDIYGADRVGDDLFADSLLALDAETGKRLWHFQGVHHDLWDRDFPSPPVLFTVRHAGRRVDAVAQTTKSGYVFLFDRVTGKPLFPIRESEYPASTIPGEVTSRTQPLPTLPLPVTRQGVTEDTLTTRTPKAHEAALKQFRTFVGGGGGQFTPPSLNRLTLELPGSNGGAEWGGPAVNPTTATLYVNENETPRLIGLTIPPSPASEGQRIYQQRCSSCHRVDRTGSPPEIPSLLNIDHLFSNAQIEDAIHQGKGRMPPFNDISSSDLHSLLRYLTGHPPSARTKEDPGKTASSVSPQDATADMQDGAAYKAMGSSWFVDPDGYPAIKPPWGTLSAIDMNTGKYLWQIPLGNYPELTEQGLADRGTINNGGPIVTAGGLVFIGATVFNAKLHAFDSRTGQLLWEGNLPFPATATPATYMVNGKQYVLIASGGWLHDKGATGGAYVAFALP